MTIEQLSKFMSDLQGMRFQVEDDDQELAEEMYQLWLKLLDYREKRDNKHEKERRTDNEDL